MSYVTEFTVGDKIKSLRVTIKDGSDVAVNITGTTLALIGKSSDIATALNLAGTIVDGPNGIVDFLQVGFQVTLANLGARRGANYLCQVTYTSAGSIGYSDRFQIRFARPADQ